MLTRVWKLGITIKKTEWKIVKYDLILYIKHSDKNENNNEENIVRDMNILII